jgi:glycosyltransferase involved in cell wall biosynthesis
MDGKSVMAFSDKVLVVGNYPFDEQQSMLRFGAMLVENLRDIGVAVDYIQPEPVFGRWFAKSARLRKLAGYLDKFVLFPIVLLLRAPHYRVVHIVDHSNALYVDFTGARRTLVTCHDLFAVRIMLGDMQAAAWGLNGRILQRLILRGLRRVVRFTAVSDATAHDLARLVSNESQAHAVVTVIPNALASAFVPGQSGDLAVPATRDAPYFLHVGGNQFYKNRPGVVRLFNMLAQSAEFAAVRLVMAGKQPDDALARELARSPVRDRIDILVAPDDASVRALYSGAQALLFISLTEGFGWPVIEAQAAGCPVVTSDRDPMRAIAGGAAILVDPEDPVSAAAVIVAAKDRMPALRQGGLMNAAAYLPAEIYPRYLQIYREIAGS